LHNSLSYAMLRELEWHWPTYHKIIPHWLYQFSAMGTQLFCHAYQSWIRRIPTNYHLQRLLWFEIQPVTERCSMPKCENPTGNMNISANSPLGAKEMMSELE
jgi:hypothetical protein